MACFAQKTAKAPVLQPVSFLGSYLHLLTCKCITPGDYIKDDFSLQVGWKVVFHGMNPGSCALLTAEHKYVLNAPPSFLKALSSMSGNRHFIFITMSVFSKNIQNKFLGS